LSKSHAQAQRDEQKVKMRENGCDELIFSRALFFPPGVLIPSVRSLRVAWYLWAIGTMHCALTIEENTTYRLEVQIIVTPRVSNRKNKREEEDYRHGRRDSARLTRSLT
jgi:hypothetical protein